MMANTKTTLVVAFWHKGPDGKDYAPGDTYTVEDPAWVTTKLNDGHVQIKGDAPTPA
jgi:hypothetical protein